MKTLIQISIICIILGCTPNPPKLECINGIKKLEIELAQIFDAEEVLISSSVLKEEIYFPTAVVFRVKIINPTTKVLDFKKLNPKEYIRFENYSEIQDSLKKEAEELVPIINSNCELSDFTSIIVNFTRKVDKNDLEYTFGSHLELKDYLKNHKKNIRY